MTAPSTALQKLSYAHDSMMDFVLQNPGATLREIAAFFGYTPAWVCRVVNSDMFQARLAERRREVEGLIAMDIPQKLRVAADLSLERIIDKISVSEDPDFLLDAFDKVMHRAGYAPKVNTPGIGSAVQNQQNNYFFLNKQDLAQMRSAVEGLPAEALPAPVEPLPIAQQPSIEQEIDELLSTR